MALPNTSNASTCDSTSSKTELSCTDGAGFSVADASDTWCSCCIQGDAINSDEDCAEFAEFGYGGYSNPCANGGCGQCCKSAGTGAFPSVLTSCSEEGCDKTGSSIDVCGLTSACLTSDHTVHWHCIAAYDAARGSCPDGYQTNNAGPGDDWANGQCIKGTWPGGTGSCDHEIGYELIYYDDGEGKNYEWMKESCENKGLSLCAYSEVCPNGGPHQAPYSGQQASTDMWCPIVPDAGEGGSLNQDWVQIGTREGGMCKKHSSFYGGSHPHECCCGDWCNSNNYVEWKKIYACCGPTSYYVGEQSTYNDKNESNDTVGIMIAFTLLGVALMTAAACLYKVKKYFQSGTIVAGYHSTPQPICNNFSPHSVAYHSTEVVATAPPAGFQTATFATAQVVTSASNSSTQNKFCGNCGVSMNAGNKFCTNCGAQIN